MKYVLKRRGFTLIEILVVVLIIGILGAIALPQYQRAVLKSRFAALMPIAKSMAESNEAFYLEHGEYADNAEDLPIQGRRNYSDGTELEFGTLTGYSYVLATRDNNFPNNYVVYQKHSENYPGEIHCEANANDTKAQEVCKSFGATDDIGETLTSGYLTYVLFGTGNGVAPSGDEEDDTLICPDNATCDGEGSITCDAGYILNAGACEVDPTYAQLQAVAAEQCPANQTQYVCTIKNGTVSQCLTNYGGTINAQGECVNNGTTTGRYEVVYNPDGTEKQRYECNGVDADHCYYGQVHDYAAGTGKSRECAGKGALSKDLTCANGYAQSGHDWTFDSHGNYTDENYCSAVNEKGVCTAYSIMVHYDNTYDGNTMTGYVQSQCTSISGNTCNNYFKYYTQKSHGTYATYVRCFNSSGSGNSIRTDGTCPSGYSIKQATYQNGKYTYKTCTSYNSIDWENATCN